MISHPAEHLKSTSNNCWISCSCRPWPASSRHLLALPQSMCMAVLPLLSMFASPGTEIIENSAFPLISIKTSKHFNSKHCMLAYTEWLFTLFTRGVNNLYAILKCPTGRNSPWSSTSFSPFLLPNSKSGNGGRLDFCQPQALEENNDSSYLPIWQHSTAVILLLCLLEW